MSAPIPPVADTTDYTPPQYAGVTDYTPPRFAADATQQPGPDTTPSISLSDALHLGANSLLFGLPDKATAAMEALVGKGSYSALRAQQEANMAQMTRKKYAILPMLAGNLPWLLTGAGEAADAAKAGASVLDATKAAAIPSAAVGAASGFGNAEDTGPHPLLQDLRGAGVGALLGGTAGAVAGTAAGVAPKIGRAVDELLPGGTQRRATRLILQNLPGVDLAQAGQELGAAQAAGRPVVLGDIAGGQPLQALTSGVSSASGQANADLNTALRARQVTRPGRIGADLQAAAQVPPVQMPQYADAFKTQRDALANQMYAEARQESPRITLSPETQAMLSAPEGQAVVRAAMKRTGLGAAAGAWNRLESPFITNAELYGVNPTKLLNFSGLLSSLPPEAAAGLQAAVAAGKPAKWLDAMVVRPDWDPETMDRVLTTLGEKRQAAIQQAGSSRALLPTSYSAAIGLLKQDLLPQAPLFAQARDAYSMLSSRADAATAGYDIGRNITASDPNAILSQMAKVAPEQVADARAGIVAGIKSRLTPTTVTKLLREDPQMDARLEAALGPDGAATLRQSLSQEAAMRPMEQAIGNSATAQRLAVQKGLLGPIKNLARSVFLRGSVGGSGLSEVEPRVYLRPFAGLSAAPTANAVTDQLLAGAPGKMPLQDALNLLQRAQQGHLVTRALPVAARGVGMTAGNLLPWMTGQ